MPAPTSSDPFVPWPRHTVAAPSRVSGITLFTGAATTLTIRPTPAGHPGGLTIRRTDLPGSPAFPMTIAHLVPEARHTVLSLNPSDPKAPQVHTAEHVLSALIGMGITDAALELDGPEIPVADGSAEPFAAAINGEGGGVVPFKSAREATLPLRISQPFVVEQAGASIRAEPSEYGSNELHLEYRLDYGAASPIRPQLSSLRIRWGEASGSYRSAIGPARTFCLLEEAQIMRQMGLFKHLEPRDMLVIGPDGDPIDNTWRFADEPARHKLLDLLGDLALAGRPIVGRITAARAGHALNHEMARTLLLNA
ncbi:MAG: UDP-3-O-acyl-N-acetylglucosamine deacetylase [Phycisphaerales bacterium]|nr:UDP-3-O-acyl-N-acetylglucosamine deacetylase [Phycisphaerales bacterium]